MNPRRFWIRLRQSSLVRNAGWMLAGQGFRLVIQAAYFVIIARSLGPAQYGAFVGAAALVSLMTPLAVSGFGNILVKNVSRDHSKFPECWGNALAVSSGCGAVLVLVAILAGAVIFRQTILSRLIFIIAVSDLLIASPLSLAAQSFQAVERIAVTARIYASQSVARLIGASVLTSLLPNPTAINWSYLYLLATLVSSISAVWMVQRELGPPRFSWQAIRSEAKEAAYFSVSVASQNTYNDIDKTMLTRMSTLDATGIYAAAYRLVDVAFVPVRSLVFAAYSRFFKSGASGLSTSYALARRLTKHAAIYSALVAAGILVAAPLIPYVLGRDYVRTVEALRWLSVLPLLKTLQYFVADAITGAGFHGRRTVLQTSVAVSNVLLNLYFIRRWSWRGAAWSSLLSDGMFAGVLWIMIYIMLARRRGNHESTELCEGDSQIAD